MGIKEKKIFMTSELVSTVLIQYHVSKSPKVFGADRVKVVLKELKQLHDRLVFDPKVPKDMSRDKKQAAQQYLMFLKKK